MQFPARIANHANGIVLCTITDEGKTIRHGRIYRAWATCFNFTTGEFYLPWERIREIRSVK